MKDMQGEDTEREAEIWSMRLKCECSSSCLEDSRGSFKSRRLTGGSG